VAPISRHPAGPVGEYSHSVPVATIWDRPFAAVLFDLDGTLVDSTAVVERVWRAWAAEHHVPVERLAGHHGVPTAQILAGLVAPHQVAAELLRLEAIEVAAADGIRLLPGAAEALAGVGAQRSAIVTSCTAPLALARIRATGLRPPPLLITASDVSVGKPDPAPYRLAVTRLGLRPADCLAVEDAPAGLASARTAGCRTLALTTTHPADRLDADAVVDTLARVQFELDAAGLSVRLAKVPG
jgi:mannitol-1-/sugar-/sorbitol-6-phosphatase